MAMEAAEARIPFPTVSFTTWWQALLQLEYVAIKGQKGFLTKLADFYKHRYSASTSISSLQFYSLFHWVGSSAVDLNFLIEFVNKEKKTF